ncbi:hypothetical protein M3Y96_01057100 [Aphelenchoides besseyi]|nr:hypothetical protein M3Y96_01057100 [Aphelenchoides besseyi]
MSYRTAIELRLNRLLLNFGSMRLASTEFVCVFVVIVVVLSDFTEAAAKKPDVCDPEGVPYPEDTTTTADPIKGETTTPVPAVQMTTANPNEKTTANPNEKTTANPNEKTTANPNEKTTANPNEKTTAKPNEKTTANPNEKTTANPNEKTTAKPNEKTTANPNQQSQTTTKNAPMPNNQPTTTQQPTVSPSANSGGQTCTDRYRVCRIQKWLCKNRIYKKMMLWVCRRTCGCLSVPNP